MSGLVPESTEPTPLGEQVDYAEWLISNRQLRRGSELLDSLREQALIEGNFAALQRIADVAHSSRYRSRRYERRFDRLALKAEMNMADVLLGEGGANAPTQAGVAALVGGIALHVAIGGIAMLLTGFVMLMLDAILWPNDYQAGGDALYGLWASAGTLLWVAALGVIIWRWAAFREPTGELAKSSLGFLASAPLAFVPLVYFLLSRDGRRYLGLVHGPRSPVPMSREAILANGEPTDSPTNSTEPRPYKLDPKWTQSAKSGREPLKPRVGGPQ